MVTHTRNLSSAFNPSKCTLTAVNTHLEQWAAILRRPGSSWGIGALLKGLTSVVVLKVLLTPPTDNPCRTWESNRQPLGYKSNSLTIRPRLPHIPNSEYGSPYLATHHFPFLFSVSLMDCSPKISVMIYSSLCCSKLFFFSYYILCSAEKKLCRYEMRWNNL